jgi:hypothetical protein
VEVFDEEDERLADGGGEEDLAEGGEGAGADRFGREAVERVGRRREAEEGQEERAQLCRRKAERPDLLLDARGSCRGLALLLDAPGAREEVDEREVGDGGAVRDGAAFPAAEAVGGEGVAELEDEAGLADAGLADQGDGLAGAGRGAAGAVEEEGELAAAADEGAEAAAGPLEPGRLAPDEAVPAPVRGYGGPPPPVGVGTGPVSSTGSSVNRR